MAVNSIIEEIEKDILDVISTNFFYNNTIIVPNSLDNELTYERGYEKKGKIINTCVLFVDIRNSVALTKKHHTQTMGRIYTSFTKAVLKVARYHKGHTRNIIGDRIMIVFPVTDCFSNAIDCAISINHISKFVINKHFKGVDFKCGIGIDYGELKVIKVGIQRHGTEKGENKGLVWVGYPANIASRLTDFANKKFEEFYFEVVRDKIKTGIPILGFYSFNSLPEIETVEMSVEEFSNKIGIKNGQLFLKGGKLINFLKKSREISYPEILMTESVFNGYKYANPLKKDIKNNYWNEQNHKIMNITSKIFGSNINWDL